jgi:hypothetical protein
MHGSPGCRTSTTSCRRITRNTTSSTPEMTINITMEDPRVSVLLHLRVWPFPLHPPWLPYVGSFDRTRIDERSGIRRHKARIATVASHCLHCWAGLDTVLSQQEAYFSGWSKFCTPYFARKLLGRPLPTRSLLLSDLLRI